MSYDVASPANERIRRLVRLREKKHRDSERLFAVEEVRILERAVAAGHHPVEVYWCPDLAEQPPSLGPRPVSVSPDAINKASYRSNPSGLIALFPYFDLDLDRLNVSDNPLILVAAGIEKPGNLGAMLRVADSAGIDGLIAVTSGVDPFNPNVVRASTGSLFTVPIARSNPESALRWLKSHHVRSLAAVATADISLWETDLSGPTALWIGSEAEGLGDEIIHALEEAVAVPMRGVADSLNASVSAALLIYEAVRQRTQSASE